MTGDVVFTATVGIGHGKLGVGVDFGAPAEWGGLCIVGDAAGVAGP